MVTRRTVLAGGAALACSTGCMFPATAQAHRVTQLVIPFPAGSLTDIVGRQIADLMGPVLRPEWSSIIVAEPKVPWP